MLEESGGGIAVEPRRRAGDGGRDARAARRSPERRARPWARRAGATSKQHYSRAVIAATLERAAGRADSRTERPPDARVKLVYVTSSLPHGPLEAFVLPEVAALERLGHEVWVVPMCPRASAARGRGGTSSPHAQRAAALGGGRGAAAREVRPAPRALIAAARRRRAAADRREEPPRLPEGPLARAPDARAPAGPRPRPLGLRRARPSRWSRPSWPAIAWSLTAHRWDIREGEPPAGQGAVGLLRAHDQRGRRAGAARARRAARLEPGRAADGRRPAGRDGHAARRAGR